MTASKASSFAIIANPPPSTPITVMKELVSSSFTAFAFPCSLLNLGLLFRHSTSIAAARFCSVVRSAANTPFGT